MEKITGNEPINYQTDWGNQGQKMTGLTIRQHFAAMVMAAYSANPNTWNRDEKDKAEWAVKDADALIEALNK